MPALKPYAVLSADILDSSVWSLEPHARLVWITLILICDTDGFVGHSVPGIARAANVTLDQARDALERFQEPDPDSRTPEDEGRRIKAVERGFQLLNFHLHLDRIFTERAKARDRQQRSRDRRRGVTGRDSHVTDRDATVTCHTRELDVGSREESLSPRDSTDYGPSKRDPRGKGERLQLDAALAWIIDHGGPRPLAAELAPLETRDEIMAVLAQRGAPAGVYAQLGPALAAARARRVTA